jgi:hypothetical protein
VEQHTRVQALSDFLLIPLFLEESDPVKITRQDHHKISFLLHAGCLSLCSLERHTGVACACRGALGFAKTTCFMPEKGKIRPQYLF